MPTASRAPAGNRLLASLPAGESRRLLPHLEPVPLEHAAVLFRPGETIRHVYFPDAGLVSIVAQIDGVTRGEAGVVGREGMVGVPLVLGEEHAPFEVVVQVAGLGHRMDADAFRAELRRCPELADKLHRYLNALLIHIAQVAACNSYHNVHRRCCRWLLLARDRLGQDEFTLTHKFLAIMLGVRRQGVTEVARVLQRRGLIRYQRGRVTILDPQKLRAASCSCYPVIWAAFERLKKPT